MWNSGGGVDKSDTFRTCMEQKDGQATLRNERVGEGENEKRPNDSLCSVQ